MTHEITPYRAKKVKALTTHNKRKNKTHQYKKIEGKKINKHEHRNAEEN